MIGCLADANAAGAWAPLPEMGRTIVERLPHVGVGLIVFVAFGLIGFVVKRLIRGGARRLDPVLANMLGSLASATAVVIGALTAAVVVFPGFRPADMVAGVGITSIAIGFVFKDMLQNLVAGIFILRRRPFQVGDQIRTKDLEGTVEDINIRTTILRTYDGERVVVPNSDVYANPVLVRTAHGRRRVRFTVGVGYPDSLEEARAVIHRVLASTDGVLNEPAPWVYVTELAPSSVNFTVYFWTESEQANVLSAADRVATGIKLALDGAGIDIPYPHTVVLFHDTTGTRNGDIPRRALACKSEDDDAASEVGRTSGDKSS